MSPESISRARAESPDYDYIVIGSGFGGSVAALRLAEKGYRVLVLEKGKELKAEDFPNTNWNLKRWMWMPELRFYGLFKLTFMRHITILSGVGVGGGSLVYANTMPMPDEKFFRAEPWGRLADWKRELMPHYETARRMMGVTPNPRLEIGDMVLFKIAKEMGRAEYFKPTEVAVFFGDPEKQVDDPYFDGRGPKRKGCNFCGACMTGCRYDGKNSLDKNYLYLAKRLGAKIQAESLVYDVRPLGGLDGRNGYKVFWRSSTSLADKRGAFRCKGVIFAGGVLGTLALLLKLRGSSLPRLSDRLGRLVRTNSESLLGVTTLSKDLVFSDGIAIGSILKLDEHSHVEPVRYGAGSGFWRILQAPLVSGKSAGERLRKIFRDIIRHPETNFKAFFVDDFAKRTQILLFMQTLNSTLRLTRGRFGLRSTMEEGPAPTPFIPEAHGLAKRFAEHVGGRPGALLTESILGIPTTAHILGGCTMGRSPQEGVIDKDHRVFGYANMYVCDGSAFSANPGVNPSLTILAMAERAMSKIPPKGTQEL